MAHLKKENKKKSHEILVMVITLAMLIAIEVVLSRLCSMTTITNKYSLGFISIIVAAILYGPLAAGTVAAMSDFIGATLFPLGAYFPGFTVTAFISGLVYGFFLHKKQTLPRIICSSLITHTFCSLLLNSYFIAIMFSKKAYWLQVAGRVPQSIIMTVLTIVVTYVMSKQLMPRIKTAMAR